MLMPFEWGARDCCLWAADAVRALTGIDIAEEYRGKYNTELQAYRLLQSVTGGTVEAAMDRACTQYEWIKPLDNILFARRGDIVSYHEDKLISLGVVALNGRDALFQSDTLTRRPVSCCSRAWSIN
jgi:hypothetical protein